ncbi:MAG: cytochrome [Chthoniobacteraceae bacterium]|nr:cytochrome [Chthoniobacteraceae bacterium]
MRLLPLLLCGVGLTANGADSLADLEQRFNQTVHPFLETYCFKCHGNEKPKGDFDLRPFVTIRSVIEDERRWKMLLDQLCSGDMPPEDVKRQPSNEDRAGVVAWIEQFRKEEALRNAGDPGAVLAHRLSNAEYDYTIRDLAGVDIQPTREFPVDPANQEGFDNSGESLTMSPGLFKKYMEAARFVSEHLVLKPDGLAFAPHPVIADTDRDKYCVKRIVEFYRRQPTDCADYFQAAWTYKNRDLLGKPGATLDSIAAEFRISPKYLARIWPALSERAESIGPIAALQAIWRNLPASDEAKLARQGCETMRDLMLKLRQKVKVNVPNLTVRGVNPGAQALVLWKDRQMAANRRTYGGGALQLKMEGLAAEAVEPLTVPGDAISQERYEQAFKSFCEIFPDAFYVSERARVWLTEESEKGNAGRLLSAGFHSQMGYFRDDAPLCDLILTDNEREELDRLCQELDFITLAPIRQLVGFLWFERTDSAFLRGPEFDFARPENKEMASEAKIKQLAEVYTNKIRNSTSDTTTINAVIEHFERVNASIRWVDRTREAAEPSHLKALQSLAERAYRRPLAKEEEEGLIRFYWQLRKEDGLPHEDAVRDTVVSIFMSPNFAYRIDLAADGAGEQPLNDYALASRLSYFLWSSMPDAELLNHAASGDLHQPEVLVVQARRMLKDERVRGFATEFAGNWLDFRRFEEHNAVDRERFSSFTNELRQAMFEEPLRFITDLVSNDRSILDLIFGTYTFVNPLLARHYGMPESTAGPNDWVRVNDAVRYGRGGLMPMAVFLTKNAPGLRTSPVKRGNWVVRRILGEQIPPPPAKVPELPANEEQLGSLTLRETLERHRQDKSCAGCHARFDAMGLVFEGYGPIGELRDADLGGRPVDAHAIFPGGSEGSGIAGLREYIGAHRKADYVENLCRKLLSYGLGRSLKLTDDPAIAAMRAKLELNGYRFSSLIESIVTSRQFLNKRGQESFTSN